MAVNYGVTSNYSIRYYLHGSETSQAEVEQPQAETIDDAIKDREDDITTIFEYLNNHIKHGVLGDDATSGQEHADEDSHHYRCDVGEGEVVVNGVWGLIDEQADFTLSEDGASAPLDDTDSAIVYAVCATEGGGTIDIEVVAGTPGGAVTTLSDEDIESGIGHSNWVRLFDFMVTRDSNSTASGEADNETGRRTL